MVRQRIRRYAINEMIRNLRKHRKLPMPITWVTLLPSVPSQSASAMVSSPLPIYVLYYAARNV